LPSKSREKDVVTSLSITRFDAGRDGPMINVIGVVGNIASWDIYFTYKISTWNGNAWTLVAEGGTRSIRAKDSMNVQAKIPPTNQSLRLKLEVNGHAGAFDRESTSREFKLAALPPPVQGGSGSVKPADATSRT